MPDMNNVIGVILGGGAGQRLFPLTMHRAKPAVPLGGKYRLIDIPVSNCINSNVNRIFVLTQYNSASLNRHIARSYQFDRYREGFVTIIAAEQTLESRDWFQGTADAVRRSMPHVRPYRHSHVLILSGDQLYTMDYRKLLQFHLDTNAEVTLATVPVKADEAPAFGILKTDSGGVITEFHEKPPRDQLDGKESPVNAEMEAQGRIYLASMGIYLFNTSLLQDMLEENPDEHDFGKEVIPRAIQRRHVVSYAFTDYWSDVGTIRSFFDANLMLAKRFPEFDIYNPVSPLYTNARILPPAKIVAARVEESLIGEASVISNAHIQNSVIGIRSFIGANTTIKNTVFMGADYYPWHEPGLRDPVEGPDRPGVDEGSYIEGAIIDRNVSIGKRCVIKNRDHIEEADRENFFIREGIVVIPKNVLIPDDTII